MYGLDFLLEMKIREMGRKNAFSRNKGINKKSCFDNEVNISETRFSWESIHQV